jgi:hypothetical protein
MVEFKMPNWCDNTLRVIGAKTTVRKFMRAGANKEGRWKDNKVLSFHKLYPVPDDVLSVPDIWTTEGLELWVKKEEAEEEYRKFMRLPLRFPNGVPKIKPYDWKSQNWGTNRDALNVGVSYAPFRGDRFVAEYHFDTAWSPPLPLIDNVAKSFKTLQFSLQYVGECNEFRGVVVWKNGAVFKEVEK